jgi:hypothetical protein
MWSNLSLFCEQSQQGYSDLEQSPNAWARSPDRAALGQRRHDCSRAGGSGITYPHHRGGTIAGPRACRTARPVWTGEGHDQQEGLQRQAQQLEHWALTARTGQKTLTESDSGLTTTRTGLLKLLALVQDEQVAEVVVTCSDRLARFGVDLLTTLFEGYGTTLTILSPDEDKTPEEELTEDVLAIIASVGRLSGLRSPKRKELLECDDAVLHKA